MQVVNNVNILLILPRFDIRAYIKYMGSRRWNKKKMANQYQGQQNADR